MAISAGIDVGTGAVKTVIFEVAGENATCLVKRTDKIRQRDPLRLAAAAYDEALTAAGLDRGAVDYVATTGEGESVDFHTGHFYSMTTHARGAIHLHPAARAVPPWAPER